MIVSAQRKWLIEGSFLLQFFLDKMTRIYCPMSILVRSEQEKYFFRLKTAINYGTMSSGQYDVKRAQRFQDSRFPLYHLKRIQLTNRFHVAVRLFSNRSQMTSKCGKNKKVAHEAYPSVSLMFLPHFDVFCDLLLNQTHGNMESICFI